LKLTSKGRYAVTAMLDLAFHTETGPVTLSAISKRQDISLSYLEQLFTRLRKQQLVRSTRGPGGGYSLNRPTDQLAVAEIVAAVDETVDTTRCSGASNCHDGHQCLAHELWDDLSQQIFGFLNSITLRDLMQDGSICNVAARQDQKMQDADNVKITLPSVLVPLEPL
jgi:Rrf2 family iron-sulfur cluster assembly transcriptional regulator